MFLYQLLFGMGLKRQSESSRRNLTKKNFMISGDMIWVGCKMRMIKFERSQCLLPGCCFII